VHDVHHAVVPVAGRRAHREIRDPVGIEVADAERARPELWSREGRMDHGGRIVELRVVDPTVAIVVHAVAHDVCEARVPRGVEIARCEIAIRPGPAVVVAVDFVRGGFGRPRRPAAFVHRPIEPRDARLAHLPPFGFGEVDVVPLSVHSQRGSRRGGLRQPHPREQDGERLAVRGGDEAKRLPRPLGGEHGGGAEITDLAG
jgi:hypothetical protein